MASVQGRGRFKPPVSNYKASVLSSAHCPNLVHERNTMSPKGPWEKTLSIVTSSDRRLRKASDQPSGHSQVTESSGSTPESCPDLSDEDFVPGKWLLEFYTCWLVLALTSEHLGP